MYLWILAEKLSYPHNILPDLKGIYYNVFMFIIAHFCVVHIHKYIFIFSGF